MRSKPRSALAACLLLFGAATCQRRRPPVPADQDRRSGRRLPRRQGPRSVSLARAGRARIAGSPPVGGGAEQRDLRLSEAIPQRERIRRRLTQLWNFEKYGVPFKEGGRYFYFRNDGLQNQAVLYTQDALDGEPRVLIDPNSWSKDGTVALGELKVSPDGSYVAYGIQDGGTDWRTWRVLEIATGKLLDDELEWVKFTDASWTRGQHRLLLQPLRGTRSGERVPESEHEPDGVLSTLSARRSRTTCLIYTRPDHPEWGFGPDVTDDGKYLVITVWPGHGRSLSDRYAGSRRARASRVMLIEGFDSRLHLHGQRRRRAVLSHR